jgi:hypothetical protein
MSTTSEYSDQYVEGLENDNKELKNNKITLEIENKDLKKAYDKCYELSEEILHKNADLEVENKRLTEVVTKGLAEYGQYAYDKVKEIHAKLKKKDKLVTNILKLCTSHLSLKVRFKINDMLEMDAPKPSVGEIQYCEYCGAVNEKHDANCPIDNIIDKKPKLPDYPSNDVDATHWGGEVRQPKPSEDKSIDDSCKKWMCDCGEYNYNFQLGCYKCGKTKPTDEKKTSYYDEKNGFA